MHPVVELEGVVGVSEVLFCQFFAFAQAASFFLFGFWHKRLGKPRELCQVFFFFKGGLCVIAKKKMGQIISTNESHSVQNSANNPYYSTCHAI